eukprot:TRINITY_DN48916_c0_g1_i1.p1 TRINITY_DN48916_c0_g1~~TRINITY_DN48916_c0_g1_i1.p1  ORF type:complete len:441 (-),score=56.02 TRINITY_DN48916_c0_g1_i1:69-1295(-)
MVARVVVGVAAGPSSKAKGLDSFPSLACQHIWPSEHFFQGGASAGGRTVGASVRGFARGVATVGATTAAFATAFRRQRPKPDRRSNSYRLERRSSGFLVVEAGEALSVFQGFATAALVATCVGSLSMILGLPMLYGGLAFGIQYAFFLTHAWPQRSERLYDISGALTHLSVVVAALVASPTRSPRQIVAGVMAVVWCTRLGSFLFTRILRDAKDERFTDLKRNFWKFSIAWSLQVAWVFILELPVMVVNSQPVQPLTTFLDFAGWFLWFIGFIIEATADGQKFEFRSSPENKGRFISSGLWRYSRHPNYFGEILMWVGLCTSCFSGHTGAQQWLVWLSPAFNALLLLRVSGVPMLEAAGEARWGTEASYRQYMDNTSCVIPWFPAPELECAVPSVATPSAANVSVLVS